MLSTTIDHHHMMTMNLPNVAFPHYIIINPIDCYLFSNVVLWSDKLGQFNTTSRLLFCTYIKPTSIFNNTLFGLNPLTNK